MKITINSRKFVGAVGWEKAEDVLCCLFLYFVVWKITLTWKVNFTLVWKLKTANFKNKVWKQSKKQKTWTKLKISTTYAQNYVGFLNYKIQNTKYKIQNTTIDFRRWCTATAYIIQNKKFNYVKSRFFIKVTCDLKFWISKLRVRCFKKSRFFIKVTCKMVNESRSEKR